MSTGTIRKRSVKLAGHSTSVSVEDEFWEVLKTLAQSQSMTVSDLLTRIDADRPGNLSSAIRLYVLKSYQA